MPTQQRRRRHEERRPPIPGQQPGSTRPGPPDRQVQVRVDSPGGAVPRAHDARPRSQPRSRAENRTAGRAHRSVDGPRNRRTARTWPTACPDRSRPTKDTLHPNLAPGWPGPARIPECCDPGGVRHTRFRPRRTCWSAWIGLCTPQANWIALTSTRQRRDHCGVGIHLYPRTCSAGSTELLTIRWVRARTASGQ